MKVITSVILILILAAFVEAKVKKFERLYKPNKRIDKHIEKRGVFHHGGLGFSTPGAYHQYAPSYYGYNINTATLGAASVPHSIFKYNQGIPNLYKNNVPSYILRPGGATVASYQINYPNQPFLQRPIATFGTPITSVAPVPIPPRPVPAPIAPVSIPTAVNFPTSVFPINGGTNYFIPNRPIIPAVPAPTQVTIPQIPVAPQPQIPTSFIPAQASGSIPTASIPVFGFPAIPQRPIFVNQPIPSNNVPSKNPISGTGLAAGQIPSSVPAPTFPSSPAFPTPTVPTTTTSQQQPWRPVFISPNPTTTTTSTSNTNNRPTLTLLPPYPQQPESQGGFNGFQPEFFTSGQSPFGVSNSDKTPSYYPSEYEDNNSGYHY